jgi:hypothetical protein
VLILGASVAWAAQAATYAPVGTRPVLAGSGSYGLGRAPVATNREAGSYGIGNQPYVQHLRVSRRTRHAACNSYRYPRAGFYSSLGPPPIMGRRGHMLPIRFATQPLQQGGRVGLRDFSTSRFPAGLGCR